MNKKDHSFPYAWIIVCLLFVAACSDTKRPPQKDIAVSPEQLNKKAIDNIKTLLDYAEDNKGDIGDSLVLFNDTLVRYSYEKNYYAVLWSYQEQWKPYGDSLFQFLENARQFGLFPEDYHYAELSGIRKRFEADTLGQADRRDAALWSRADLLLTDAFIRVTKDVKLGRLAKDSITMRTDSVLSNDFYPRQLNIVKQSGSILRAIEPLEPRHKGYQLLKAGLKKFLDSADYRPLTIVPLPSKDSIAVYKRALQTRLYEGGFLSNDSVGADSATIAAAVKKFQKKEHITVDGKAGAGTIRLLNLSDREKFIRIAITMDRYKMLPDTMPARYVWVNLPSYYMRLVDADSIKMVSKIICGKSVTRTPVLTSAIYNMVTYPQWTMPVSIIVKEVLPGVKKDTGYFRKKGYSLIDAAGNEVDPQTVDWKKYHKGIPYKVVQGSGDDNALGVLKFNFSNKYAVYLHDTNQRYLFAQTIRSLSHGCVRVQEWQKLAYAILHYDDTDSLKISVKEDSLNSWLSQKVKRTLPIRNKLPVYIRYFTCEGKDNGIVFYDDMYGEDKLLREKYFANK
ncbi:MAG TPA: L,D-transpeptidase family protein [Chitinophagaceae bacterium]|nr:L,D-transpeptidase family protein [Chitinophagaceae bacterium]